MKKPICFAPWIHSYKNPLGQRALCCEATPFESDISDFDEYWNSDSLKEVRSVMLQGRLPEKYCQACIGGRNHSAPIYQRFTLPENRAENIIENTTSHGHYSGQPTFLDYRNNNLCNLGCRTCGPEYSSKIEGALEKSQAKPVAFKVNSNKNEFKELIFSNQLECDELYFASGEAFIQADHWEVLSELVRQNRAPGILLEYNTNLQFPLSKIEAHKSILEQFKRIDLSISIDAAEGTGEFIRDGLRWNKFVKNVEYIRNSGLFHIKCFDITLTLPGIIDLLPLLKFLEDQAESLSVRLVKPGGYATLLSPYILDDPSLKKLISERIIELETFNPEISAPFMRVLRGILKEIESKTRTQFSFEHLYESFLYANEIDKSMKRSSLSSFYSKFSVTKQILEPLENKYKEMQGLSIHKENDNWLSLVRKKYKDLDDLDQIKISLFPQEIDDFRADTLIVLSYPSVLAKILNRKNREKFRLSSVLESKRNIKNSKLYVESSRLISLKEFFQTQKTINPFILTLLGLLPNSIFSLHKIYFLKPHRNL